MKIATDRFGEIEVEEEQFLNIPEGLIGFPSFTRAVLLDHKPNSPFRWLQCVDDPDMAFVVIDPLLMVSEYPLGEICDALAKNGPRPKNIAVAAITTIRPLPLPITVNLVAPLAFDPETRRGAQIILTGDDFHTKHVITRDDPEAEKEAL